MMEVTARTDADKKGGHLAKNITTGGLLLRELAQCPAKDELAFQDVRKHNFFNTNNLWIDLQALKAQLEKRGGSLPLPIIKNSKTVDPRDKTSTKVFQLETAMGAAISSFDDAIALVVPRSRFAPVKTTNDLFALRSDSYTLTKDYRIVLNDVRGGVPPHVSLDSMYKFVDALDKLIPNGPPSLLQCQKLTVVGPMSFASGVVIIGKVIIKNNSPDWKIVPPGTYETMTLLL